LIRIGPATSIASMDESKRLTRDSAFSYTCNRCKLCCHDNQIFLDPYEIARLARNRKLSTTEFINRFLIDGGYVIPVVKEDRACIFLADHGCDVHQDRPLVCRTYPLRRAARASREEFINLFPHPETKGEYGENGTAGDFLKTQDVERYVPIGDKYFALTHHIIERLGEIIRLAPKLFRPIRETMTLYFELRAHDVLELIDIDRIVGDHCRGRALELPGSLEGLIALHIEIIQQRLAALLGAVSAAASQPSSTIDREVDAKRHDILQMAGLAGMLGISTRARIKSILAAAVLGTPPAMTTNVADQKAGRE
jgi:Fe-S-cluster containining protein